MLKRMYIDRMINPHVSITKKTLNCPSCLELAGVKIIYAKEQRLAYRLFAGSITKEIVSSQNGGVK